VTGFAPHTIRDLSPRAQALATLIPNVYISRDEALADRPLLRLLEALAEPLAELERAADQLYEDHFVETASAEALPLIAALVGAPLYREDAPGNRAVIANMVRWLRGRGTITVLEEVIAASSGWSGEVDEAFRSIQVTQDLNAPLLNRGRVATLWDPIVLTDPLSRHAPGGTTPRDAALARERSSLIRGRDESVEQALRRLGRADAGRAAVAPRLFDYLGWTQPQVVVLRTSRIHDGRVEDRDAGSLAPGASPDMQGQLRIIDHATRADEGFVGLTLEPAGGIERSVWSGEQALDFRASLLTEAHEPSEPETSPRTFTRVLTPTALADDPDAVETGGALHVAIDGVTAVGPDMPAQPGPALFAPVIGDPVLRFADSNRPSPDDDWELRLVALDTPEDAPNIASTVIGNVPLGAPAAENPATLEVRVSRGSELAPDEGPAARRARSGALSAIRLRRRLVNRGYRRTAGGDWTSESLGPAGGRALTPVVSDPSAADDRLIRVEQRTETGVAVLRPDGPAGWSFAAIDGTGLPPEDRPDLDPPATGPGAGLIAEAAGTLLLVAPDGRVGANRRLGIWRIGDPTGAPSLTRLDAPADPGPGDRMSPSLALHDDGRVYLFGGRAPVEEGSADTSALGPILDDLWSFAIAGADAFQWRPHRMRLPRDGRENAARMNGRLLSTPDGLVLIGGASEPGLLSSVVMLSDLSGPRPRWNRLPDLPLASDAPGALWARADGAALEALVWADSTAPVVMRLENSTSRWSTRARDTDAPNPPAEGEALFLDAAFLMTGPPPLPPSEVVFSKGADAQIAFLPAIDLTRTGDSLLFHVDNDGSTRRWFEDGTLAEPTLRLDGPRAASTLERRESAPRIGVSGRLSWAPLKLRQCSLGPWDNPLALDLDNGVGFDPRLGRLAVRRAIGLGRITLDHRIGRAGAIGPATVPTEAALPAHWLDPDPDSATRPADAADSLAVAFVDPVRSGTAAPAGLYVGDLATALGHGGRMALFDRSPRVTSATLSLEERTETVVTSTGFAQVPFISPDDDGISLIVRERLSPGSDPEDGPRLWLRNVDLGGTLDLGLSAGRLDMRWCRLGRPGGLGLGVAGAGFQSEAMLSTLPDVQLVIHLYGCFVSRLALPPWVQLVAAGCTFDAGTRASVAVDAPGARLNLRHCTVHGAIRAGLLEASSCVFAGQVATARTDLGYLRYSILTPGSRAPLLYKCIEQSPSLTSLLHGDLGYLNLDENNGAALLNAAERGRQPGAYEDRAGRLLEATARADDFIPMGLEPHHFDRARTFNFAMNRRLT